MTSTESIAIPNDCGHDDLVDPRSKEVVRIDPRLFDKRVWQQQPELVHDLIGHTAAHGAAGRAAKGAVALAHSYLANPASAWLCAAPSLKDSDYFLVLGHQLKPDATPSPELITRLEGALWASEKNPDARVVVSGGAQARGICESEVMKRWLVDKGVDAGRILQESQSLDTVENISLSTRLLMQHNAKEVCLITGDKSAGRSACLLSSHLQHIDSAIKATCLGNPSARPARACADMAANEKYLLFKDLGRIFGLWTYRTWSRSAL